MKEGSITIEELGPRLKLVRQLLGVTQRDLAQALDINQAIISKFENGGMVYASVLLAYLSFFRGQENINFLLQPGDDFNINQERAMFSNDAQRDVVILERKKVFQEAVREKMEEATKAAIDGLERFAEFCYSDGYSPSGFKEP